MEKVVFISGDPPEKVISTLEDPVENVLFISVDSAENAAFTSECPSGECSTYLEGSSGEGCSKLLVSDMDLGEGSVTLDPWKVFVGHWRRDLNWTTCLFCNCVCLDLGLCKVLTTN